MKKIFFWIFYPAYLICFNFFLTTLSIFRVFGRNFDEFLNRLTLYDEFLEKIFQLKDIYFNIYFILINLFFAYLFSRTKINREKLLNFPLIVLGIKAVLFWSWSSSITENLYLDTMGKDGAFVFTIVYGIGTSLAVLDISFYIGLVIFSILKEKKEKTVLEENKTEVLEEGQKN